MRKNVGLMIFALGILQSCAPVNTEQYPIKYAVAFEGNQTLRQTLHPNRQDVVIIPVDPRVFGEVFFRRVQRDYAEATQPELCSNMRGDAYMDCTLKLHRVMVEAGEYRNEFAVAGDRLQEVEVSVLSIKAAKRARAFTSAPGDPDQLLLHVTLKLRQLESTEAGIYSMSLVSQGRHFAFRVEIVPPIKTQNSAS